MIFTIRESVYTDVEASSAQEALDIFLDSPGTHPAIKGVSIDERTMDDAAGNEYPLDDYGTTIMEVEA